MVNGEALLVLELENLFFDRIFADKAKDKDVVLLAYAMGTAHGLVFYSRVPPIVEEDDTVGRGKVEAKTTSLQTDEEYGNTIVGLELSHRGGAIAGVAIEGDKADVLLKQELLHLG